MSVNPRDIVIACGAMGLLAASAPGQDGSDAGANDVQAVLTAWGPCDRCPEDVNSDGVVDVEDLLRVLGGEPLATGSTDEDGVPKDRYFEPEVLRVEAPWSSGVHSGAGRADFQLAAQTVIAVPDAPWVRLHVGDSHLGSRSYIRITSLSDGGQQNQDARAMRWWYNFSAFFVGDAVSVELFVAPGDEGVFVEFDEAIGGISRTGPPRTQCGNTDDRVASNDDRAGRFVTPGGGRFCTGWLTSNGALVTAGHCADSDPDGTGSGVPDGVLDWGAGTLIEFNFPASDAAGNPTPAAPEDQYPINLNNAAFNFNGSGSTLGADWAVVGVNPNGMTEQTAHVANGFFRMTRVAPPGSATARITGCGTDTGTQNRTLQTHTGPYNGESTSGANVWHRYRVDTEAGNSGSPIIWTTNGITVGIHTNGGCGATRGNNTGTSWEHDPLENAMEGFDPGFTGGQAVYVDAGMPALATETGTVFEPFNTVAEGAASVPAGGLVSIVEGTYQQPASPITKAMLLRAPVGSVVIR